jgi:adhesin HecA-like repeat protein
MTAAPNRNWPSTPRPSAAGAIKLIGTEAGVGVKLDGNLEASGGDIQLDANGHLSLALAFTLAADSLDNSNGKLLGNQAVTLRVQQALTNVKGLIAAANVDVQAGSLNNNGGTLTSRTGLELRVTGQLDNQGQGLINATQNLNINTASLNNQNGGSLLGSAIAIDFSGAMGDLNNANGLITTTRRSDNRSHDG